MWIDQTCVSGTLVCGAPLFLFRYRRLGKKPGPACERQRTGGEDVKNNPQITAYHRWEDREVRLVYQRQRMAAIFLDRDGTIIEEVDYLKDPAEVQLIPGAIPALRILQRHFPLVVITNQAGIARSYLTENQLHRIHDHLRGLLAQLGISLAGIYYCPHPPYVGHPPYLGQCQCRKPRPGMLLAAAADLALDLSRSYTIGDKLSDIAAGSNATTHTILVRTGYGKQHEHQTSLEGVFPDYVANDLLGAAAWIMERTGENR